MKMLNLKQVSSIMQLSMDSVYKLARADNNFPAVKVGGQYRVEETRLQKYIDELYQKEDKKASDYNV